MEAAIHQQASALRQELRIRTCCMVQSSTQLVEHRSLGAPGAVDRSSGHVALQMTATVSPAFVEVACMQANQRRFASLIFVPSESEQHQNASQKPHRGASVSKALWHANWQRRVLSH